MTRKRTSLVATRALRAGQLLVSGEWKELTARLVRKVRSKGDPPAAQDDPKAYARWLRRQKSRFAKEWKRADAAGAEDVRIVFVRGGAFAPEPKQSPSATLFVRAGDEVEPGAERLFAAAFARGADVVTCDHDERDAGGRLARPRFLPAWSPARLLEDPYLLPAFLVRDTLLAGFSPPIGASAEATLYAIALHVRDRVRRAEHIAVPLVHAHGPLSRAGCMDVARESGPAEIVEASGGWRARFPLPKAARASVLIPFRDQPELLDRCLDSVFAHTDPRRFDVRLLDNGSLEPRTAAIVGKWTQRANVSVLPLPGPFNFAALNNRGAGDATGSHLLLLNNDTEVLHDDWLEPLMELAAQKDVGAVGCKLLYPDRTLQHAGVWLGVAGLAAHAYAGLGEDHAGHGGELRVLRNLSAVTGACLMIERRKWRAVSGMNEKKYKVAFNDLDLCLRLEQHGWRTVYTPHVTLVHHESKSRGARVDMREERAFLTAYEDRVAHDPYVSPSFSRLVADGRWR
ncbi:MAG: glycosyltransferase family 2 protein [Deltaproteobacteria bacterium]|nr:glycosyltransferase family 2 protein [Deltaproteobacteria bacterium]